VGCSTRLISTIGIKEVLLEDHQKLKYLTRATYVQLIIKLNITFFVQNPRPKLSSINVKLDLQNIITIYRPKLT
jgi:hypothetical protein